VQSRSDFHRGKQPAKKDVKDYIHQRVGRIPPPVRITLP
jgi:hypothetical protein